VGGELAQLAPLELRFKKMASWYVYIVECADHTLYTGVTRDLDRRVHEHNHTKRGASYTRARRPVRLVFSMERASRSAAQRSEVAIKRLNRVKKLALIQGTFDGGDLL